MKKIRLTLLMLMAFMMSLASFGQSTLTVHDGTVTNSYVPMYVSYFDDFTRAHVVYPASELEDMVGAQISSITFYCSSNNMPYTTVSTVDLYMTEVAQEGVSAFIDKSTATMVYQGTVSFEATADGGEATIVLSTPYTYNGGNLLFGCDNTTDAEYKFVYFYGETVNGASYSGYNPTSLEDVTSGTQRNFLPKTTFTYSGATPVACPKPTGLAYSDVTATSAVLSWTAGGSEPKWTLEVSDGETTYTIPDITENPYTLEGLTSATTYTVKVKANCTDEDVSTWSNSVAFTTPCATEVVTSSWVENFSNGAACWTLNEYVSGTTAWTIATTLSNNGDVSSLYDGACAKFYVGNRTSITKLVSPVLDLTALGSSAQLSFQMANAYWDDDVNTLKVYYRTSASSAWVEIAYFEDAHTDWEQQTLILPNTSATYQIAFEGIADYGYAIFIDDVTVAAAPACAAPSGLAVADITSTSATISWTANSGETEWTIEVSEGNNVYTIPEITENPYTLEGLTPATAYSVRVKANCSATEESDWSGTIAFSTACDAIAVTDADPYQEGFENTSDWGCWSADIEAGTVNWTHSSSYAVEGTQTAYLNYGATDARLTSPIFDLTGVTTPQLTFSHRQAAFSGRVDELYVYYRTAPAEEWVELAAYTTEYASMTEETILLPGASATYQISFFGHCVDALSIYLDDVNITNAPSCFAPTDVTISDITTTSATIAWTDNNTTAPQSWVIDLNGTEYDAATNPFTIETLTASTAYTVKVKAICTDDDESDWSAEAHFNTECGTIVVTEENPYNEGFEGADFGCWSTQILSGSYDWILTTQQAAVGTQSAGFSYSGDSSYLISPVFDLTQVSNVQLSFQHKQPQWSNDPASELYVYYRASETEEWNQIAAYTTFFEDFTLETLTLPNTSATYQICFKGVGAEGYNVFLDDVTISGEEPVEEPCETPTNVAVENGVVTWTGDAASYNVYIVSGEEVVVDTIVSTTSYTIQGLNDGDHATVTIQAICGEDNLSDWSEAVEFDYIIDGINSYAIQANIFPNPTTGNVTVESNAINADITVFDMFGKLMMTSKVAAERTELNFSSFAPGVYMVRIANTTGTTTIKVVKE